MLRNASNVDSTSVCFKEQIHCHYKKQAKKNKAKEIFLLVCVLRPYFQFVRNPYISMLSACTVKFSLGTEQCYQHFCVIFAEALIAIHACKYRILAVQYILDETCSVSTSAVSAHPQAPLEVGVNPPVQLSSF